VGRKNKPIVNKVEITDIGSQGKAIARIDDLVTFVSNAIPGDIVDLRIHKKSRSYQEGQAINFHKYSSLRTDPFCEHFSVCGGCKWQDLQYESQLKYKQQEVYDALKRIGKLEEPSVNTIIPADETRYYRNKLEFTFSNSRWLDATEIKNRDTITDRNALGFHVPGMFDRIVDLNNCYLQPEPSNTIRLSVREYALKNELSFFDPREHKGLLRNLIVRNTSTGEVMVVVCFHEDDEKARTALLEHIKAGFPDITSLMYVINPKANDSIYDLEIKLFSGRDHLIEVLDELKFRIGPKSFFQTNTNQALKLYALVKEYAGLSGQEIVYDLYTGTGTIANYLAASASKLIGIDNIKEAIDDARQNSKLNGIKNTHFVAGDIKDVMDEAFIKKHGSPDVLVTDPPRAGMHKKIVQTILAAAPAKIVYVSCNPSTQARDIQLLSEKYRVSMIQPVDMFPHTYHVENICVLELVN